MFVYLSKKIAIPNGVKLHSLAWNPTTGGWQLVGLMVYLRYLS
jgi:hypothetical protein